MVFAVGVDFSLNSKRALEQTAVLAQTAGAKVVAINVLRPPMPVFFHSLALEPYRQELEQRQRERLEDFIRPLCQRGIDVEGRVLTGDVEEVLATVVYDMDAKLLAVARHSCLEGGTNLLGSTTERILRQARVPVLTVASGTAVDFTGIICAVDFSANCREVLQSGVAFSKVLRSDLEVLHVLSLNSASVSLGGKLQAHLEVALNTARKKLVDFLGEHDTHASTCILKGKPSTAILEHARRERSKLLVIGARGCGLHGDWGIGTTVSAVVRAHPHPLLIIPPSGMNGNRRLHKTGQIEQPALQSHHRPN